MLKLSRLKDVTQFYNDNFRNEVYLITDDVPIKCNGILLAARSPEIEEIMEDTENIPANEYSDNLPALYDCLDLIYGSTVAIGRNNFRTIFKFGKIFDISEMVKGISDWISNDLPYSMFWEIYLDLTKLGLDRHSIRYTFHDATCKFIKENRTKVLTDALEICRSTDVSTIKHIVELFAIYPYLSVDDMLKFLKAVLVTTSSLDKAISTVIFSMISYINGSMTRIHYNQWFITTSSLYTDTLTALADACNDVDLLRKIFSLLHDVHTLSMFFKEPSLKNLTRKVLHHFMPRFGKVNMPDMEKFCRSRLIFSPIHCVFGEFVVMTWYHLKEKSHFGKNLLLPTPCLRSVRILECDIIMFEQIGLSLEEHGKSCKDHVKMWCDNVLKDYIYEDDTYKKYATDIRRMLKLKASDEERYLYYYFKTVPAQEQYVQDNTLPELKGCIRKGDGTPLSLPEESLHCTDNMLKFKERTRKFSYDADAVPSYGKSGHWYLVGVLEGNGPSRYSYDRKFNHVFISLIASTKREILKVLEECIGVYLYFIPPCDCNPIKKKSES